jgi:hypothetical protein
MDNEKKMQAAITGVLQYLQEEQEHSTAPVKKEVSNQPSNWAAYSRQMMMINRDRFQRRTVKR